MVERAKFRRLVRPGDRLELEATALRVSEDGGQVSGVAQRRRSARRRGGADVRVRRGQAPEADRAAARGAQRLAARLDRGAVRATALRRVAVFVRGVGRGHAARRDLAVVARGAGRGRERDCARRPASTSAAFRPRWRRRCRRDSAGDRRRPGSALDAARPRRRRGLARRRRERRPRSASACSSAQSRAGRPSRRWWRWRARRAAATVRSRARSGGARGAAPRARRPRVVSPAAVDVGAGRGAAAPRARRSRSRWPARRARRHRRGGARAPRRRSATSPSAGGVGADVDPSHARRLRPAGRALGARRLLSVRRAPRRLRRRRGRRDGGPRRPSAAAPALELAGEARSLDAHHLTAPDPDGDGAERAMRGALAAAGEAPSTTCRRTARPRRSTTRSRPLPFDACSAARSASAHVSSVKGALGHAIAGAGVLGFLARLRGDPDGSRAADGGPREPDAGLRRCPT